MLQETSLMQGSRHYVKGDAGKKEAQTPIKGGTGLRLGGKTGVLLSASWAGRGTSSAGNRGGGPVIFGQGAPPLKAKPFSGQAWGHGAWKCCMHLRWIEYLSLNKISECSPQMKSENAPKVRAISALCFHSVCNKCLQCSKTELGEGFFQNRFSFCIA